MDPSIYFDDMVLFKHRNNFPFITGDGISEFENSLLDCSETGEVQYT
jgi:hypothetical protein